MQSVQQSGNLTKRVPSVSRVSGGGNGMPKTAKSCVFCGDAFTNKNDTKMMSCLHKAHTVSIFMGIIALIFIRIALCKWREERRQAAQFAIQICLL